MINQSSILKWETFDKQSSLQNDTFLVLVLGYEKNNPTFKEILPACWAFPTGFFEYHPMGIQWDKPLGHSKSSFVVEYWAIPKLPLLMTSTDDQPTQEDIDNRIAAKCECCKKYEYLEFMRDMPEGYYCIECWEDIYG